MLLLENSVFRASCDISADVLRDENQLLEVVAIFGFNYLNEFA